MTCAPTEHAEPYQCVEAKRSFDKVPVLFDWHDLLASKWAKGITVSGGLRIRLTRAQSRGFQFRALNDGVTGRREPNWPRISGAEVDDGGVTWIAEPVDVLSLRTSIATSAFPAVTGLTLSAESNQDLVYSVTVAGGDSGSTYEIRHQVILANGEEKEGVAVLPVAD